MVIGTAFTAQCLSKQLFIFKNIWVTFREKRLNYIKGQLVNACSFSTGRLHIKAKWFLSRVWRTRTLLQPLRNKIFFVPQKYFKLNKFHFNEGEQVLCWVGWQEDMIAAVLLHFASLKSIKIPPNALCVVDSSSTPTTLVWSDFLINWCASK